MFGWIMAAVLLLPLPASLPEDAPPAPERIMAVPADLRSRLQAEVVAGPAGDAPRLQRLVEFMFAADGLHMAYRHDATYTVEQAYAARNGNCLTFTLLFVALARAAGLEAYPQVIEETLSWQEREGTLYRNNHVNAGVRIGGRRYTVDVASDSVIARHHPAPVSDQRLLALYYNNQAVDLLAQDRIVAALAHMDAAIQLDPGYATHWSNAGVVHLRSGDLVAAERNYAQALALAPEHAGALFNLLRLSERSGDRRREAELRRRLERVQQRDPFHHFLLAIDYEKHGDYQRAAEHYQRAIRLHPDEHRFHSALALVYLQLGDVRRASRALLRAQAHSEGAARALYQTRLDRLRKPPESTSATR